MDRSKCIFQTLDFICLKQRHVSTYIYICHPQAHTIPESHIEEGNGLVLCLIKITYSKNTDNI